VQDPVLGLLKLGNDGTWWEGEVQIAGEAVGFKLGGNVEPSPALLAHAHDIVRSFDAFKGSVVKFLADEAQRMKPAADEIRQLVIEDVCLFWPDRPDDGMIFFKGPDEYRVWRCDYINRQPTGLGFDT
jgi:hypothetical protein